MIKYLTPVPLVLLTALLAHADEVEKAVPAEEVVTPFAGSIYQTVATILVLFILFVLLTKYAWGPILKGLEDRENKIKSDLEAAEKAARDAKATLEEYKAKLAQAHADATRIVETARKDAETTVARIQAESKAEIDQVKARALADVKYAKEQAIAELYTQTAVLATTVASKILKREVKAADQAQLVADSLAEIKTGSLN